MPARRCARPRAPPPRRLEGVRGASGSSESLRPGSVLSDVLIAPLDRLVNRVEERPWFGIAVKGYDNSRVWSSNKELLDLRRGVGRRENDVETLLAQSRGELIKRAHRDGVISL